MLKADYIKHETLVNAHDKAVQSDMPNLLIKGNDKTGTLGKYGYMYRTKGLAIHDCINRTSICENACYAVMDHLFNLERGHGVAHYYSQLAHTDPLALFDKLDLEIADLLKKPRIRNKGLVIRIHEAADFLSAMHVRVYIWLAAKYPMVIFFGYSRSWQTESIAKALAELNTYDNAFVRESTDNERPIGKGLTSEAFFGDVDKEPTRSFKCVEQLTKGKDNHIKCIDCGLCWTRRSLNVVFKKH